ncbi:MAG: hypothetical protein U0167_18035 [bacterium]
MRATRLVVVGALAGSWSTTTLATTIRVPEDYPTVLAGVDASAAGDSVLIGPGTWVDAATRTVPIGNGQYATVTSCAFVKGGTALIGVAGAGQTTIRQEGAGESPVAVLYANHPGEDALLEGLTVVGGFDGRGVEGLFSGALKIHGCVLTGTTSAANFIHTLRVDSCDLEVEDSEVRENSTPITVDGGFSSVVLRRCRFFGNTGQSANCRGYANCQDHPWQCRRALVEDCVFEKSGPVTFSDFAELMVHRNMFVRMTRDCDVTGLGVWACTGAIEFNTFAHDSILTLARSGAGLYADDFDGVVSNNTFYRCHGPFTGGAAAAVWSPRHAVFTNNLIVGTTGGPAVAVGGVLAATASCNDYWENAAGNTGPYYPADAHDLFVDPLFCNAEGDDWSLRSTSPCADGITPSCGRIGEYGVGCGPVSVEPMTWGKIKNSYRVERGK